MFNMFNRQKLPSSTTKPVPSLAEMWVCWFSFTPYNTEEFSVVIKKCEIVSAKATPNGIRVLSNIIDNTYGTLLGYVGRLDDEGNHWIGFFETEDEAKQAFDTLMSEWMSVMLGKMFGNSKSDTTKEQEKAK